MAKLLAYALHRDVHRAACDLRSDLVVQNDRVVLDGRHGALDRRPDALVTGGGDPFLAELLALELQLEPVVVLGGAVPCRMVRRFSIFTRM
jgi:hypothetical protein